MRAATVIPSRRNRPTAFPCAIRRRGPHSTVCGAAQTCAPARDSWPYAANSGHSTDRRPCAGPVEKDDAPCHVARPSESSNVGGGRRKTCRGAPERLSKALRTALERTFSRPATPSRHENRPHRDMRPLRAGAERTIEAPWKAVANAIDPLEPDECKNRFTACVYDAS